MHNIYICTDHDAFWPVGVCSVVVSTDEEQAKQLLSDALANKGLSNFEFSLQQLDISSPHAKILLDGSY